MPTGYTLGVMDGSVTTFEEYALICARAFGATINMRDEPIGSDIPEFTPSPYHKDWAGEAIEKICMLSALTDEQKEEMCGKYNADLLIRYKERVEEERKIAERYKIMLAKAKAFTPPSDDHKNYAEFLVSQLEESIRFDCDHKIERPVILSVKDWYKKELDRAKNDYEFNTKEYGEEVDRTKKRNDWVLKLKQAIKS